jgi:hypothetical protein
VATILGRSDHRASSSSGPASNRHTAGVFGLRPKAPLDWQTKHRALLLPSQTCGVLGPPCIRRRPIVIAGALHGDSCPWCGHRNRVAGAVAVLEAITAGITPCAEFTGDFALSPAFRSPVPRPLGALSGPTAASCARLAKASLLARSRSGSSGTLPGKLTPSPRTIGPVGRHVTIFPLAAIVFACSHAMRTMYP